MGEGSRRPSGMLMSVDLEPVQLVGPDGTPTAERRYHRDLPEETLRWLYEMMVVTRELDTEFVNLQRQGELALYTPVAGRKPRRWVRRLAYAKPTGCSPNTENWAST